MPLQHHCRQVLSCFQINVKKYQNPFWCVVAISNVLEMFSNWYGVATSLNVNTQYHTLSQYLTQPHKQSLRADIPSWLRAYSCRTCIVFIQNNPLSRWFKRGHPWYEWIDVKLTSWCMILYHKIYAISNAGTYLTA